MNLYLLERTDRVGYDEYVECVVAAASEEDAVKMHPSPEFPESSSWAAPEHIRVTMIGNSCLGGGPKVVSASFNAG